MKEAMMNTTYHLQAEDGHGSLIQDFFSPLLKKELVSGLLLPKMTSSGSTPYAFINDPEALEGVSTLSPLVLVSGARAVSQLTFKGMKERIGALLRPCEIRALLELTKLKQVDREKVLILGYDCLGTLEVDVYKELYEEEGDGLFTRYQEGLMRGEVEGMPFREACLYCQSLTGEGADINLAFMGGREGEFFFEAMTSYGQEVLGDLGLEEVEPPAGRLGLLDARKERNQKRAQEAKDSFYEELGDFNGFLREFAYCLGCGNCRTVCPICYCRECIFETLVFEHNGDTYLKWAKRKGAIRIPSDTILFHLTRLNHMGLSCVGCGLCESACPSGIPLLRLFKFMGEKAQELFSYVPGMDGEEPIPLTTFEEEELDPR